METKPIAELFTSLEIEMQKSRMTLRIVKKDYTALKAAKPMLRPWNWDEEVVLAQLFRHGEEGLSCESISESLDLPQTQIATILASLEGRGFIQQIALDSQQGSRWFIHGRGSEYLLGRNRTPGPSTRAA